MIVPVDKSGRVAWLPPVRVFKHNQIRIAGISGIDPAGCGRNPKRYDFASVITEDSVIESTLAVLEETDGRAIDVLLTHDGLPDSAKTGKGTLLAGICHLPNPYSCGVDRPEYARGRTGFRVHCAVF